MFEEMTLREIITIGTLAGLSAVLAILNLWQLHTRERG